MGFIIGRTVGRTVRVGVGVGVGVEFIGLVRFGSIMLIMMEVINLGMFEMMFIFSMFFIMIDSPILLVIRLTLTQTVVLLFLTFYIPHISSFQV